MKDQELFKQLHTLSKMTPDEKWKASQRSIMLSQINVDSEDLGKGMSLGELFKLPLYLVQNFSQPVMATFLVAFLFLTGGFASLKASQDTKPGDSLYVAKIVGEKTQLALAFSDKKKAQLGLGFAANRAEEIKKVIAEDVKGTVTDDRVEQLVRDFKKEISVAKRRIAKISESSDDEGLLDDDSDVASGEDLADEVLTVDENMEEVVDIQVFSAGSSKEEDGLEVSNSSIKIEEESTEKEVASVLVVDIPETNESSSTEETLITPLASPEFILEQASELLQADAYDAVFSILDDAGDAMDQTFDLGEVQGVEESASSTDEVTIVEEGEDDVVGTSTEK